MPELFTGSLRPNEIFAPIYNMIIDQHIYSERLNGLSGALVDEFRTEGSMYGDTKLFYASDILKTYAWGNDAEAVNLLALERPDAPKCQKIVLDQFRQIRITVDNYLTKRAWSTEGVFSNFNSIMQSYIAKTKKLYDTLLINVYVGNVKGEAARSLVEIALSDITETGEAGNRLKAQMIARELANLADDMEDASRDFNDYGFMDSFSSGELMIIWNNKFANEITYVDLPTIFHKDNLVPGSKKLNARYFGEINTSGGTTASSNTTIRSAIEKDYGNKHLFPGDLLPNSTAYAANETYTVDDDVICKIIHKNAIKYMSGFETSTEFFNPRSLTQTNYLTFGYSKPDYLKHLPVITVHAD